MKKRTWAKDVHSEKGELVGAAEDKWYVLLQSRLESWENAGIKTREILQEIYALPTFESLYNLHLKL